MVNFLSSSEKKRLHIMYHFNPILHIITLFLCRQGDSFDWLAGFVNTAVQIISLVSSIVSPETSTPQKNTIDRNDVAGNLNSDGDDLDVAMGTLMAYGGKYLREMALWAWEYGTQTPLESLGTVPSATQTLSQVASVR